MLNVVSLMGRIVHTPELRHTQSGVATCTFSIAVERNHAPNGEERKTDFFDIVVWSKTADFVCKYFGKGNMIAVDGSIQTRKYEDKKGNKRTAFEIVANHVHFTGERTQSENRQAAPEPVQYHATAATYPSNLTISSAPKQTDLTGAFYVGDDADFAMIDEDIPF